MKRSTFISTALAAICTPFVAKATVKAAPSVSPLANPVTLRVGIMGFPGSEPTHQTFVQNISGGLVSRMETDYYKPEMVSFLIHGDTAEQLLEKVGMNAAVIIARMEHPDDDAAFFARLQELTAKISRISQ